MTDFFLLAFALRMTKPLSMERDFRNLALSQEALAERAGLGVATLKALERF
jgi:hypothetical protein